MISLNTHTVRLFLLVCLLCSFEVATVRDVSGGTQPDLLADEMSEEEEAAGEISDPLEPLNRVVFEFNDKLYFWGIKPLRTGYRAVVPRDIRVCLGNFVSNLATPVVLINTLLQGRWEDAGVVLTRFGVNTVLGVYGFGDPAASELGLTPRSADFGQTLGTYGAGAGIYLCWPLFGPSNVRDSIGLVADNIAHPLTYLDVESAQAISFSAGSYLNRLSLSSDYYEEMKRYSLDPYVSSREAYHEYRNARIGQKGENSHSQSTPAETEMFPAIETQL